MSSQKKSSIRIACPQCGGNVKLPPFQAGQKCSCPHCGGPIVVPGAAPPEAPSQQTVDQAEQPAPMQPASAPDTSPVPASESPAAASPANPVSSHPPAPIYPQRGSEAPSLRPNSKKAATEDEEEFGVECPLCRTRLYARSSQIGTRVKCPDCHSPVVINAPRRRGTTRLMDDEDADSLALSEPIEPPSSLFVPPESPVRGDASPGATSTASAVIDGQPTSGTTMQYAAQRMLDKAAALQQQEDAEARERSPDRHTHGLLAFFSDRRGIAWWLVLSVWFEIAAALFRWGSGMTKAADSSAIVGEASSLLALAAVLVLSVAFLAAVSACGLVLVRDSFRGLRHIESWPGANFLTWGRDVFYIVNAGTLAALPGIMVGVILGMLGMTGTIVYTAATSFVAIFPPILLSMFDAHSARSPFNKEMWGTIVDRPEPWKVAYLITTLVTVVGLFGFVIGLIGNVLVGLVGSLVMVACIMIYFRTVGRLFCVLAGRDLPGV